MTQAEFRDSSLADASMAAEDCKGSADYAAYAFKQRDESEGRRYVRNLEENLQRLKGYLSSVTRHNDKIAAGEP